jgi:hypothetical protein
VGESIVQIDSDDDDVVAADNRSGRYENGHSVVNFCTTSSDLCTSCEHSR